MIRVVIPAHLRTIARVDAEVSVIVEGPVTVGAVVDALEAKYPALRGTIRDQVTFERRPFCTVFRVRGRLFDGGDGGCAAWESGEWGGAVLVVVAIAGGVRLAFN